MDSVEFVLREYGQIRSLRKVLSEQTVRVFVGAPLPRGPRVAEVGLGSAQSRGCALLGQSLPWS